MNTIKILGYKLHQTSFACPEQYDVYKDGKQVGYLRLRHGYFRAEAVPGRDIVYSAYPNGDGSFCKDERMFHLENAISCLANYFYNQSIEDHEKEIE